MLNQVIQTSLDLSLEKESLEKKTNKNFGMKVNSISKFDYYIKNTRQIRISGFLASAALIIIMTLMMIPCVNTTSTAEAAPGVANQSESIITMTSGYSSAELSITPSSDGVFSYSSSDELAKFEVTTNNFTGYTLSIEGNDNTRQLTNSTTGTVLDSISSTIDTDTFNTSAYNGKWGYRPSKYNSTDNVGFLQAPTTTPSTLNITTCANGAPTTNCPDNQTVDEYTIGLGARVDMTKPAGTYTNTFILTAVGNPVAYILYYLDNTNDSTVSNLPATNSGTSISTNVEIATNIPTRTGYTFNGWCNMEPTINTDGSTTCPSEATIYPASTDSVPNYYNFINQTLASTTGSLYTTWNINSYLQTVEVRYQNTSGGWGSYSAYSSCTKNVNYGSTHSCTIAATNEYKAASLSSYTVTSTNTKYIDVYRQTYTVSVSNSNTTSGSTSLSIYYGGQTTVTVTPSSGYYLSGVSCPSGYTCSGYSTGTSYTGQQTVTIKNNNTASGGTLTFSGTIALINYCTQNGVADANCMQKMTHSNCSGTKTDARDAKTYTVAKIGSLCWMTQNLRFTSTSIESTLTNINTTKTISYGDLTSGDSYNEARIHDSGNATTGVWYNYAAASAMTITGSSNSTEANYSLCPAGWRLPTTSEQAGIKSSASAFKPVTGGYYSGGSLYDTKSGCWWSSTAYSTTHRDSLYWNGSSLNTDFSGRVEGIYVRCVRSS